MNYLLKSLLKQHSFLYLSITLLAFLGGSAWAQSDVKRPQILVSIQPIALLVRDLVGDQADVHTLLPGGSSPHHFQLKVSDRKRLLEADTLIWVGEDLERFLEKVANQRATNQQAVIELVAIEGLEWPQMASVEAPEQGHGSDHQEHHQEHDHNDHHHAHGVDPHLWLSPANVQRVWHALAQQLGEQFPHLITTINNRLASQTQALQQASSATETAFAGVTQGYYVYHDGVAHFAKANNLDQLGALTQVPDEAISAKHLRELNHNASNAACLIADWSEVQQASKYGKRLGLRVATVDVLATQTAYTSYNDYYTKFAKQFQGCFILTQ
ncbi:zinc ABC transporter substrate-binding protein [Saccharophagus degradans]|uniref:metal ABC transporter solute-binding protein, Zn/Mn family n=1 Tax=Saccharophagus degradans TaxID=86304 RepID=UPI002477E16F|nr:zinc ABC transporter substrate-binding protein [Saccharophagus degradans]WGO98495.1 zinc ABC transporter substrate-binding protein [Saccharophagus degradans]